MENVKMKMSGKILTIEIDTAKRGGKSASGKTTMVASTKGNIEVEGAPGVYLGLNAYTKP